MKRFWATILGVVGILALLGSPGAMAGAASNDWSSMVKLIAFKSVAMPADFTRDNPPYRAHVRLYFQYQNLSSKTIAGIEFKARFKDAFGDVLHTMSGKSDVVIPPGQTSKMDRYFYYENIEFLYDEPYDRIASPAQAGTLRVEVTVTRLAFSDGTVVTFQSEQWSGPAASAAISDTSNK